MPIEKWITVEEKGNENPEITKRVYTVLPMELANFIRKNLNYFFVRGNAMEKPLIYVYMDGVYKNVSDEEFKGFIKSFTKVSIDTNIPPAAATYTLMSYPHIDATPQTGNIR